MEKPVEGEAGYSTSHVHLDPPYVSDPLPRHRGIIVALESWTEFLKKGSLFAADSAHSDSSGRVADKAYPDGCMYHYWESEGHFC